MLPHRFRKVTAFANAMCHNSKLATIAKVNRYLKEDGRSGKGVEMHDCNIHDVTEAIYTIERLGKSKVLGDMEGEAPPKDSAGSTPSQPSGGAAPSSGPSSSSSPAKSKNQLRRDAWRCWNEGFEGPPGWKIQE